MGGVCHREEVCPHRPPVNIPRPCPGYLLLNPWDPSILLPLLPSKATNLDSSELVLNPGAGPVALSPPSPPHPTGLPSPSQSPGWVSMHSGLKVLLSSLGTVGELPEEPQEATCAPGHDRACPPLSPHSCTLLAHQEVTGHSIKAHNYTRIRCVGVSCLSNSTMLQAGPPPSDSAVAPRIPASGVPAPLALLGAPILALLGFSRQVSGWHV